jgi:hypothetical protein
LDICKKITLYKCIVVNLLIVIYKLIEFYVINKVYTSKTKYEFAFIHACQIP